MYINSLRSNNSTTWNWKTEYPFKVTIKIIIGYKAFTDRCKLYRHVQKPKGLYTNVLGQGMNQWSNKLSEEEEQDRSL